MNTTTTGIPFTAWEQAVFVALFIAFVGGLLAWMDRQLQNVRKVQQAQQTEWQKFIGDENVKWQNFIKDERLVSGASRKEDREKLDKLTDSLDRLTAQVTRFHEEFAEHTVDERARFDALERQAIFNHPKKAASE